MKVDWGEFRQIVACAAILAAILSGKLQIPVGRFGIEPNMWTEIRLWCVLVGAALLAPEIRDASLRELARLVVVTLLALIGYLFVRSLFDITAGTAAKRIDLVYLFVEMILVAVAVLHGRRIALMAYTIIALALVYLAIAIAGQIFPSLGSEVNFGLGWGPVGGPITFNRVQFLAFCVAMCLAVGSSVGMLAVFAALAALFLFAALASLQKAAILAALLALTFAGVWLIARMEWKRVAVLFAVSVVAISSMAIIYGERLGGRLDRLTETNPIQAAPMPIGETAATAPPVPAQIDLPIVPLDTPIPVDPPVAVEPSPIPQLVTKSPQPPQPETTFSVDALGFLVRYCIYEGPQIDGQPSPALSCPSAMFSDRSSRLTFWAEAIRGWIDRPFLGRGIASYEITVPAAYTLLPDTYRYPHNLLLEVAFEAGGLGVILLISALIIAIRSPFRSGASLQTRVYSAAFMAFMLVCTMFSGDFYDSRLFWFGAITLTFWKAAEGRRAK